MNGDEKRAEQFFRAITDAANHANIGVIVSRSGPGEHQLDILYLNDACERLIGWSKEEIVARGIFSFVTADELPRLQELNAQRAHGGPIPSTFRTTLQHREGHPVPVEVSVGFIELDGEPVNVSFVIDVSWRVAAETALRKSRALFQRVIDSAPDGILVLRWPTVLFANPVAARMLEVERPEDAVGVRITDRISRDDATAAEERIRRRQGSEPRLYRGIRADGKDQWIEISSIPIEFDGEPATLAFARDVTEHNAILARLVETDKLSAVNAIAAGVAHEINNPLAYMLLHLESLARELKDAAIDPERTNTMLRRVEDMREGAERVKAIVRDLQALTRNDRNIRGPVELDKVIDAALLMARHQLRQHAHVEKSFEPVPCVFANPTRLEQLFFNLLVNAAQAERQDGSRPHRVRIALRPEPEGFVTVEIADEGAGMPRDVLAHAFEPFFTTKPLGIGTGLGLPICKRIVDDLGGDIQVESELSVGTRVRVLLPRSQDDAFDRATGTTAALSSPTRRPRGRILIVDDEKAVAESLRFALRDDHDVDTANSAREARAAFDAGVDYDVVLCDLVMPIESGMDLHAYARVRHPQLAQRFLFMTGGAFTAPSAKFLSEITYPRIEKPFEIETLRALIDGLVAERAAQIDFS